MTNQTIRTKPAPLCTCCQSKGTYIYRNLKDRLFGVSGEWHLKKCNNKQCGLVWQDPMPIDEDLHLAYQTYYTHKDVEIVKPRAIKKLFRSFFLIIKQGYLANKFGYRQAQTNFIVRLLGNLLYLDPGRRSWVDSEVYYLPSKSNGKLLEIGFGSGEMLKGLQMKGWDVTGIDFDSNAVINAKKKGLNVHHGSLADQKYESGTFDAIVMSHVLEHVYKPSDLIKECYRLLKTNGVLVSITPNSKSLLHTLYKENWRGLEPPRHISLFNVQSALALFKQSGFTNSNVKTTIRGANGVFIASRYLKRENTYVMGAPVPLRFRLLGAVFQSTEWFLLKFNKSIGEELLIIAKKQ